MAATEKMPRIALRSYFYSLLIACLFSIALAYESVAFETTLIQMGEDQSGQFGR